MLILVQKNLDLCNFFLTQVSEELMENASDAYFRTNFGAKLLFAFMIYLFESQS